MKTNYSIFTRVLVLAICFIMLVGGLTACFQEAAPENNVVTTTPNNNGSTSNGGNTENNGGELEVIPPPHVDDVLISTPVTPDAENKVPEGGVNMSGESASATVPGGVQMEEGATELALTINGIEQSEAQIELLENEVSTSFDVHVAGVAQSNLVPMEITLAKAVAKGLNSTSLKLYHVENGVTYEMTRIANNEAFTAHNQFKYDPVTGDVTISIASFSEIALVCTLGMVCELPGCVEMAGMDSKKPLKVGVKINKQTKNTLKNLKVAGQEMFIFFPPVPNEQVS